MTDRNTMWADALVVLSNCLQHPDPELRAAVGNGSNELMEPLSRVGIDVDEPPSVSTRDLTEDYESLFGAFRTPFAPPAASPYKEWYGDRSGLMGGPPASAMEQRYAVLEVEVPDAFPADHVALQLEYASLLVEADAWDELGTFVEAELDWVDGFAQLVTEAAAEAPFYRWCVTQLVAVVEALREELDVSGPSATEVETMANRARQHVDG